MTLFLHSRNCSGARSNVANCCSRRDAIRWVYVLTLDALAGDRDCARLLPRSLKHLWRTR